MANPRFLRYRKSTDMIVLLIFFGLQLCDMVTTLAFLRHGVSEGNPLVAAVLLAATSPVLALAIVKAGGCALGICAWRTRRTQLLRRANLFFAACVAWNVLALMRA